MASKKVFSGIVPIWVNDNGDWEITIPHDDMDIYPSDDEAYFVIVFKETQNEDKQLSED